jgi:predicted RNase H-like HicB family nuclease
MAQHYVVVLVPQQAGGWRAHFPDFPGCHAEGARVELAIEAATREVISWLERARGIPTPQSYEEVRSDEGWAHQRGIDWSTAVIGQVQIA